MALVSAAAENAIRDGYQGDLRIRMSELTTTDHFDFSTFAAQLQAHGNPYHSAQNVSPTPTAASLYTLVVEEASGVDATAVTGGHHRSDHELLLPKAKMLPPATQSEAHEPQPESLFSAGEKESESKELPSAFTVLLPICSTASRLTSQDEGATTSFTTDENHNNQSSIEEMVDLTGASLAPPQASECGQETGPSVPITIGSWDEPSAEKQMRPKSILKRCGMRIPFNNRGWKVLPKVNLSHVSLSNHRSPLSSSEMRPSRSHHVQFTAIHVRTYDQCVGDNPAVSYGPPIQLDWTYVQYPPVAVEVYETTRFRRGYRRALHQLGLNYYQRRNILVHRFGFTEPELLEAEKVANKIRAQRNLTKALMSVSVLEEWIQTAARQTGKPWIRRRHSGRCAKRIG